MNDYSEVDHGYDYVQKFFKHRPELQRAMDDLNAGADLKEQFDRNWQRIQNDTYIWSVSAHKKAENAHGRLSMWRAFGPLPAQAALVLKLPRREHVPGLKVFFRPIAYIGYEKFEREMLGIVDNIASNAPALRACRPEEINEAALYFLAAAVASLKHVAFKEEQEWRAIFWPRLVGVSAVKGEIKVVSGIPQTIYRIPLRNTRSKNKHTKIEKMRIADIVEKIIVGPSAFPIPIKDAFVALLKERGIKDPERKVGTSDIPLRT